MFPVRELAVAFRVRVMYICEQNVSVCVCVFPICVSSSAVHYICDKSSGNVAGPCGFLSSQPV